MYRVRYLTILALGILIFSGSSWAAPPTPVFVSILPQKYFVEQIGKSLVDVKVMVQPGASPATYEPKPRQMADISKSELYFAIGVPFESAWLDKIAAANPKMKVVQTADGVKKLPMASHHHEQEDHNHLNKEKEHHVEDIHEDDHHQEGRLDPHIWLAPSLVKIQAKNILSALKEADPGHADNYDTNYLQFIRTVDALDRDLKSIFNGKQGLQFMVFHPSWGYFAGAYGLNQIPIEIEGKAPKPAQLKKLIEHARTKNIKVIFVQPQFSTKSASLIAHEIDGKVIFADPLAENWEANLKQVADNFKAALK